MVLHFQVIAVDQDSLGFQGERILGGDLTAAGGVRPLDMDPLGTVWFMTLLTSYRQLTIAVVVDLVRRCRMALKSKTAL